MTLTQVTTGGVDENINIDSNTLKVDGTNNRVGIGTASPANKLHVSDTSGSAQIRITGSSGSSNIYADSNIYFQPNGSTAVTFASSGKVGIGCTPVRDFQLHTSDASSELMLSNSTTGATAGSGFMLQQDGNDNYIWNKENSFMSFGTNAAERMRIDSSGRLLVGSSTVQAHANMDDLQVGDGSGNRGITISSGTSNYGTLAFGDSTDASGVDRYAGAIEYYHSNNSMAFLTSSTSRMTLDSSGRLGIGRTSVSSMLDLQAASGRTQITLRNVGNTADASTFVAAEELTSGNADLILAARHSVRFFSNLNEKMRIDSSGRLLLGTTTEGLADGNNLTIADSGPCGITLRSGSSSGGAIYFSDATSGAGEYAGFVEYLHSSDALRFATGGTERMRIDSSGNVTLGRAGTSLHFQNGFNNSTSRIQNGGGSNSSNFKFLVTNSGSESEAMRIDSSGRVKCQAGYLYVQNSASGTGDTDGLALISDGNADKYIWNYENTSLRFGTNSQERMRIEGGGNTRLEIKSGLYLHHLNSGAGNSTLKYGTSSGLVSFDTSSRLVKEQIIDCPYGIDKLKQLQPRKYFRTDDQAVEIGFIADELVQVMPEFVPIGPKSVITKNEDDTEEIPLGVNYEKLTSVLTKALQEAIAKIETLETKVAALEAG